MKEKILAFYKKRKRFVFGGIFIFLVLAFSFLFVSLMMNDLPALDRLDVKHTDQTTQLMDRSGVLLYEVYAQQNRTIVPFSGFPKDLINATIAVEDKDFYKHGAIDFFGGILRAAKDMVLQRQLQGGSTITQQLVKSALLSPERTIRRKVKEIVLAFLVEKKYSKNQILELYLNQVPYGGTSYGAASASQLYFGKSVKDLNLAESALLAGLPVAPTAYSPFGIHPELARQRQEHVLNRMLEDKVISQEQYNQAIKTEIKYAPPSHKILAPHFSLYVKDQLVQKYGEDLVLRGGLKVTTTLDYELQKFAEQIFASEAAALNKLKATNAAAIITKPNTGEVLAMLGSLDYFATPSGNFNVTLAHRQPGSAFKPINYAVGLDSKKVTPATLFADSPICYPSLAGQKDYCPQNYDGNWHGPVQLRFALGNSFNIPAVKMMKLNGVETVIATASAMGISTLTEKNRYGLSLTLGGGEVTMLDMATAFGVFANAGAKQDLTEVIKVEDRTGRVLMDNKPTDKEPTIKIKSSLLIRGRRIISPEAAYLISHILLDNNARVTTFGEQSYLRIKNHQAVSVKTGTTDDKRDNWTIGYTPSYLTVVWVGNNDNAPMSPYIESGVTGAAVLWNKIMTKVLENVPDEWPTVPENIIGAQVCSTTGLKPAHDCPPRFEYFIKGTVPDKEDPGELKLPFIIDKTTGKVAKPGQTENIETQDHKAIIDQVDGTPFCLDCPL